MNDARPYNANATSKQLMIKIAMRPIPIAPMVETAVSYMRKATDKKLTAMAESQVNRKAA